MSKEKKERIAQVDPSERAMELELASTVESEAYVAADDSEMEKSEPSREEILKGQITLYADVMRSTVRRGIIMTVLFLALLVYRIILGVDWRTWVAVALILVSAGLSVLLYLNNKKQKEACEQELAGLSKEGKV